MVLSLTLIKNFNRILFMGETLGFLWLEGGNLGLHLTLGENKSFSQDSLLNLDIHYDDIR